jgi:outer membrane protein assembly factor BamB
VPFRLISIIMKRKWWVVLAAVGIGAAFWFSRGESSRIVHEHQVPVGRLLTVAPDGHIVMLARNELIVIDHEGNMERTPSNVKSGKERLASGADGFVISEEADNTVRKFDWKGAELWMFPAPVPIGPPTVSSDGSIYFAGKNAGLFALNSDGSARWTNNRVIPSWPSSAPPAVRHDGLVALASREDGLVIRNPEGKLVWQDTNLPNWHEDPAIVFSPNGDLILSQDKRLRGYDAEGVLKWSLHLQAALPVGYQGPAFVNGLPIAGPDGTVYCLTADRVFAVNTNGELLWDRSAGNSSPTNRWTPLYGQRWATFTQSGDLVLVGADRDMIPPPATPGPGTRTMLARNERLICLSPDGVIKWEQVIPASIEWNLPRSKWDWEVMWKSRMGLHYAKHLSSPMTSRGDTIYLSGVVKNKLKIWVIRGDDLAE